jgi:hypothetical protein
VAAIGTGRECGIAMKSVDQLLAERAIHRDPPTAMAIGPAN